MIRVPHVACLPGDGIGPEVVTVARRVLEAAGLEATWSEHPVGWSCWTADGDPLPPETLAACREADAVLFGAITSQPEAEAQAALPEHLRDGRRYRSPILRLRRELGLWANVRPARGPRIDLVLWRENTEGLYAGVERRPDPDTAVTERVITRAATTRICEAAFDHAERHGRGRVTLVEKANVLRATGGLVREVFWAVARRHTGVEADELHVDAACALLVRDPGRFDVVVATNLFGDIFSDVAAEVAGGIGTAASANLGETHALFEPVHGSAPDIAGRGVADPRGAVAAGAMMARHLGQETVADRVETALARVLDQATTAAWEAALLDVLSVPA